MYVFGEAEPKNSSAVGHFTQLIWKETIKMGVGLATSEKGQVYVVCNYEPAGNIVGEYAKNIKPAKKLNQVNYYYYYYLAISLIF